MRFRSWISLGAYVVALLLPAAHELLFEEQESCSACEAIAADGPHLDTRCDPTRPCEDPSHHHHRGHAHDRCLLCQHQVDPGLPARRAHGAITCPGAASPVLPDVSPRISSRELRPYSARGPPPLS